MFSPLVSSSCPFGMSLYDLDLVVRDGRPLVVGTPDRDHRACTWDPALDRWTEYELENPWYREADGDYTEITSLGAAVVDGRIVICGGGDHQGFAQWDLESGAVRLNARAGGVASAAAVDFGGESLFVYGGTSETAVQVWEPIVLKPGEPDDPGDQPFSRILRIEIWDLFSRSLSGCAVAGGMVDGRRVVLGGDRRNGVLVWDVDDDRPATRLGVTGEMPNVFGLATVNGRAHVLAGGGQLRLGDLSTGEWIDSFSLEGGEISCLGTGEVNGRPVAVTGSEDGAVHIWDLADRRLVARQVGEHPHRVGDVAVTELDGRPVVISNSRRDSVCVWPWPR